MFMLTIRYLVVQPVLLYKLAHIVDTPVVTRQKQNLTLPGKLLRPKELIRAELCLF